jgi:hypothetical protein
MPGKQAQHHNNPIQQDPPKNETILGAVLQQQKKMPLHKNL